MKSTGLFGKNSGRVGGVVYSSYRGEQVVRAYQPKVNNPNTAKQIEQRAKFKLVSQVGASLGREIKLSFVPTINKETPRNAFIKQMLKKTEWNERSQEAYLPIEEIILTNSKDSVITELNVTTQAVTGSFDLSFGAIPMVHLVQIGWAQGGEVQVIGSWDFEADEDGTFDSGSRLVNSSLSQQRVLVYLYAPSDENTRFEDYGVTDGEANLQTIKNLLGSNLRYTATFNANKPSGV